MDLQECRARIDEVDDGILRLFRERMEISREIAQYKKEHGLPTLDMAREREKLAKISEKAGDDLHSYAHMLYATLFEFSSACQGSVFHVVSELNEAISDALERTEKVFPQRVLAACQGVEGAYSQHACDRLFTAANILYCESFDAVFSAIRDGRCEYGVLPLENSTAGSVKTVYDLMMKYRFKIVRSVRLKIDHNLLVKPGVKKDAIREIFSHEQAIQQCAEYLKEFGENVKVTQVANTAGAAKMVAESERGDVAALASRSCCELYGLKCVESAVQDRSNNYTRFICISKNLEIYPGANRTSIMLTTSHKPGSLYKVLGRIYSLGVNIVKLESRPIPDSDFDFMFYFDLETSVYSKQFAQLMRELEYMCEGFQYLGSYTEII